MRPSPSCSEMSSEFDTIRAGDTAEAYRSKPMPDWRATRPVDVARLNSSVFLAVIHKYEILLAVIRKFEILCAIVMPAYLIVAVLLAHHRFPSLTTTHTLVVAIPMFLTGFASHLALGLLGAMFLIAVGSLIWWRRVLAVGGPSSVLATLAAAMHGVAVRLVHRMDPGLVALLTRREHATHAVPGHSLLDQLRAALLIAPDAPPSRLVLLADRMVCTDQLTSRRAA